ncbi:MAG: CBS domain-containing protein [Archangium sp.]|nr:CBS domain-containing protein [Archangium sp.]
MEANIWPREPAWPTASSRSRASRLVGWLFQGPAQARFQQDVLRESLEALPVRRLMRTQLDRLTPGLPIEDFVSDHVLTEDQHAWPVESGGVLLGLVSMEDLRKVKREDWARTPVGEVMKPAAQLAALSPEAHAEQALETLADRQVEELPVLEHGHLLGLVRGQDLLRWLATRR